MFRSVILWSISFRLRHPFCARRDSIERNSYGNVAGWLGVRHTPVLYQNGKTYPKTFSTI